MTQLKNRRGPEVDISPNKTQNDQQAGEKLLSILTTKGKRKPRPQCNHITPGPAAMKSASDKPRPDS